MMDKDLFDFLNRHQVYIEGVKSWYQADLLRYLKQLAARLRKLLAGLSVDKLSDLTRQAYRALERKVMTLAGNLLGNYGQEWLLELRRISRVDTTVQRAAFAFLREAKDFTGVTANKVWAAVREAPIPAYGMTAKEATEDLINRSKEQLRRAIVQGYVDGEAVKDTLNKLVGEDDTFKEGTLRGIFNTAKGLVSTAIQHVAAKASELLGRIVYGCYQWVSVMDSKTSGICRRRNGTVYRYEDGPQPPAHINCRSKTIPCPCDGGLKEVPTFYAWLRNQSDDFLTDAFGTGIARRIRGGTIEVSELSMTGLIPSLSIDEYESKTRLLTA